MAGSFSNYGPGAGGGTYKAYGRAGYQNQPYQSELGPVQGAWRSQNVFSGLPLSTQRTVLDEWAKLQRQYPQYTNHAHPNTLTDEQIHAKYGPNFNAQSLGGNDGILTLNSSYLKDESPATVRGLLLKELGQVMSDRMVGTPARAADLMQKWGYNPDTFAHDALYPSGLSSGSPHGWSGDTSNMGPHQINIGGYRSFPEDAYGIAFAAALGGHPNGPLADRTGILQGSALQQMQAQGMLPRQYAPPTVPQRPTVNTNDFGRRGVQQPVPARPAPAPAVLPAQVNNPMVNVMAQRAAMNHTGSRYF